MAQRRMPIEENWFDKKTNDLLYGFLQSTALYDKDEKDEMKKLYLPKKNFIKSLPQLKKILECKDKRTIMSKVQILIDKGYLAEDVDNYYFPYNKDEFYLLIDKELLFYICTTMSEYSVKTYVYLADKMKMKQKEGEHSYYFTIKELKGVFGYSTKSQNAQLEKILGNCLALLKEAKLIDVQTKYVEVSDKGEYKTPNLVVTRVAKELPNTTVETIEEVSAASGIFAF